MTLGFAFVAFVFALSILLSQNRLKQAQMCIGNAVKLDVESPKCRRRLTISLLRTTK